MELTDSIRYIKGVGPAKEKLLNKLNIFTIRDLLYYFPRDYEDRTITKKIIELCDGEKAVFEGQILGKINQVFTKSRLQVYKGTASDGTGKINLVWFNTSYIKNIFKIGRIYSFYGQVNRTISGLEVTNPVFEEKSSNRKTGRIFPIYPLTEGLTQNSVRDIMLNILQENKGMFVDIIPEFIRSEYKLIDINTALNDIHFPQNEQSYKDARRRLAFEELLVFEIGLMKLKKSLDKDVNGISFKRALEIDKVVAGLSYKLTNAQNKVLKEIIKDMSQKRPMRRLLQGDVGSGKTVIAMLAIMNAVKNGYQAALMVPTGILAEQHFQTFEKIFKNSKTKACLLTSGVTGKIKKQLKEEIKNGKVDVVIGTHALLEEDVQFSKLGLVVTDEQHRFGVNQRNNITSKGNNPDVLVMTATPIPRTLALILYGDLDVSLIDELPPNRQKIDTFLATPDMDERINVFIEKEADKGRQVYVVCPLIEESEELTEEKSKLKNISELFEVYIKRFPGLHIEFLHGKLKASEKEEIMRRFKDGKIDVLIATTVIEVGVNVPNATIMLIENAERFGLAALHQLRGRVGRGSEKAYCILKCYTKSEISRERMEVMTKNDNGFKIAEKDLELRGPGEFLGIRQHGVPEFKAANIFVDSEILEETSKLARKILSEDENEECNTLLNEIQRKFDRVVL